MMPSVIPHMKVVISSHNFSVSRLSPRGREICNMFAKQWVQWGWEEVGGRYSKVMKKVFASAMNDRSSFRFHINALPGFKKLLANFELHESLIEWLETPSYTPVAVEYKVKPHVIARDYQVPVIEYLTQEKPHAKLVELQTGDGKGTVSLLAMATLGTRTVGIIKPQYLTKWKDEINSLYEDFKDEVMIIRGNHHLCALLDLAREERLTEKVILISSSTLRNWITKYEEFGEETLDMGYSCTPDKLFEFLGAGIRLIDECHQDFHFYFKLDTYSNVPCSISLSATLINKDPFIYNMYHVMFPLNNRMQKRELNKYTDAAAVHYQIKDIRQIKTTYFGSSNYSHGAFEESILKNYLMTMNYFAMIDNILQMSYFKNRLPVDKAIIFAASIDMCTRLTDWLKKKYPSMDIRRYVENDPYENVIDAEIRITTIGSGGTAIDIPGLSTALMTTCILSEQANVQAMGRLRKRIVGKTEFYYLVADNIVKHVQYHEAKQELMKERAKTFRDLNSGSTI